MLLWRHLEPQSRTQTMSGRPKVALGRAAGGVGTIILKSYGRLYSKSCYLLKCTAENLGFSKVRKGSGAQVGATSASKSRPRGVRTAKSSHGWASRRSQESKSSAERILLSVRVMVRDAPGSQIGSGRIHKLSERQVI